MQIGDRCSPGCCRNGLAGSQGASTRALKWKWKTNQKGLKGVVEVDHRKWVLSLELVTPGPEAMALYLSLLYIAITEYQRLGDL